MIKVIFDLYKKLGKIIFMFIFLIGLTAWRILYYKSVIHVLYFVIIAFYTVKYVRLKCQ
ncbi:MAG: hypothetical protein RSB77_00505 [Bacilli bacterium]